MIPQLSPHQGPDPLYRQFLTRLRSQGFRGEISQDFSTRLSLATDNSVYQVLPQAALFPRSQADIALVMRLLGEAPGIKLTPRGGGTGTNGQSLTPGLVLDVSRHLTRILEVNLEQGWVRVEPGVVLDQLNDHLRPLGYFFAPTLSTSSRATLGGMISTDASGKGSRLYGKTSQHILELTSYLVGGETWVTRPLSAPERAELHPHASGTQLLASKINDLVNEYQKQIHRDLPQLTRFVTGYNLGKLVDEAGGLNLNYLLSGSEGTLVALAEAKLQILPLPKARGLLVAKYKGDFLSALTDARTLVAANPSAIETIDARILELAQADEIFFKVGPILGADAKELKAINLIEFVGNDPDAVEAKLQGVIDQIDQGKTAAQGWVKAQNAGEIATLWELRKKGVGLLGNTKGPRKPIAFVEDTVVPPENLAAYIKDFRALLDSHGLIYGMFGHVDVGCLHVRPALNLLNAEDEKLLLEISHSVADLVGRHGGVIWGEHGKGFRSQYTERYFGPELYQVLRRIKGIFDPHNQLNPGKIALPQGSSEKLVQVDGPFRGRQDRQIRPDLLAAFEASVNCNGNGQCFNYASSSVICPSFRLTQDRVHSPKGRAALTREWLRRLSLEGSKPELFPPWWQRCNPFLWLWRAKNSVSRLWGEPDFSDEVLSAFQGCLSCKACQSQCPIKVDIPDFKARFLALYYQRYLRPWRDLLAAGLESMALEQAPWADFYNGLLRRPWVQRLLTWATGLVDTPLYSQTNLTAMLAAKGVLVDFDSVPNPGSQPGFVLVQDSFTSHYEAELVLKWVEVFQAFGAKVYVLPLVENGKAKHVKGFLPEFRATAQETSAKLAWAARLGIPLVGLDPAITLTYRDEYPKFLGQDPGFEVLLPQEALLRYLDRLTPPQLTPGPTLKLFGHCTETTALPSANPQWKSLFAACGLNLVPQAVGCCGMGGIYGHEAEHKAGSEKIYHIHWGKEIEQAGEAEEVVLATGYSCRSQVKRFGGVKPLHPLEFLHARLP